MTNEVDERDDDEPVLPLTRQAQLLEGMIRCNECDAVLVGVVDARGVGFYVHESEIAGGHAHGPSS